MLQCLQSHMMPGLDPDYNHNEAANVDARLTWESSSSGTSAVVHVEAQEIDSDLVEEVEGKDSTTRDGWVTRQEAVTRRETEKQQNVKLSFWQKKKVLPWLLGLNIVNNMEPLHQLVMIAYVYLMPVGRFCLNAAISSRKNY